RRDEQLERALPALPRDRPARAEQRRRPDAEHARAERRVEERPGPSARLEHVEGERGDDQGLDQAREDEEPGHRQRLELEEPAVDEHATHVQARSRVASRKPCHSKNRRSAYPAAAQHAPTSASAPSSPRTCDSVSPDARSRAASIPCVSGRPWAIVDIAVGSWSSGTLTPQNTSRKPKR